MNCERIQCALSAGEGNSAFWQQWYLRRHLQRCEDCRRVQAELNCLDNLVEQWHNAPPSHLLKGRIADTLQTVTMAGDAISASFPPVPRLLWQGVQTLKENSTMKSRIAWMTVALFAAVSGGTLFLSRNASAVPTILNMKKALQSAGSVHASFWENTSLPNRQFYQREMWVQGPVLRQYIRGTVWLIATPTDNWYYIVGQDRLLQQPHQQKPVTFDITSLIAESKGLYKDGQGVTVETLERATWRAQQVTVIQVTNMAKSPEQVAQEEAQAEEAFQAASDNARLKGHPAPVYTKTAPGATLPSSTRIIYWVDEKTSLPLHSESFEEKQGRWILTQRVEYTYGETLPANFFDPNEMLRAARLECKKLKSQP